MEGFAALDDGPGRTANLAGDFFVRHGAQQFNFRRARRGVNHGLQRDVRGLGGFVRDPGPDRDLGRGRTHLRSGDANSPGSHVHRGGDVQPNVPVDAGAGVPAGVLMLGLVHADGQHVVPAWCQVGREIVREAGVSVGVHSQIMAVDVHGRVHVDPLELHADAFAAPGYRDGEGPPVPAHAGGKVAAAAAHGVLGIDFAFDAPIVRQIDGPPAGGVIGRGFGPRGVPQQESPIMVEQQPLTWRLRLAGGLGGP